jgi:hypothetical protein
MVPLASGSGLHQDVMRRLLADRLTRRKKSRRLPEWPIGFM